MFMRVVRYMQIISGSGGAITWTCASVADAASCNKQHLYRNTTD
jgi:hypothetical protein